MVDALRAALPALLLVAGSVVWAESGPLEIRISGEISAAERDALTDWVERSANALSTVTGEFPIPRARIRVSPTGPGGGPVPWARVQRGQVEGIHFYITPGYDPADYWQDWTALHEFSHLLIPYPGHEDIWFSEGLASYYQNLLRGRVGVVSPGRALEELDAGFRRGQRDAQRKDRSLRELSPAMWRTGSYMRVYWSGAAYFLAVDLALRQRDQAPHSLDQVLARFVDCCRNTRRHWDAQALIATFDRLAGGTLFEQHYRAIIDDRAFPDLDASYRWLGLTRQGSGLRLDPAPPYPARRQALFTAEHPMP
ncbi:hypothetical protein [Ferrimonas balearica]|uniref:M61 family metallopeptidase n=1 Tax=Ferrimonas balearica TaxID=44012 RepID=UPI001C994DEE|nr:hypothetical protein [Ferrimonas balearica]MBY5993905.1 hypothetical protein [Ferrimonas balearica]